MLSYTLNNAYRINDQFWIQGLGESAQAAVGATFFVLIMNFGAVFLAVGGTLALVSRAVGARDPKLRDSYVRHALGLGLLIGGTLTALVLPLVSNIVGLLGLQGETALQAEQYLGTLYLFMLSLALFPVLDAIFIGRGNTRVPMLLQILAVGLNWFLNPLLIYGADAAQHVDAPGVGLVSALAGALGIEGRGIAGAALATGIARTTSLVLGLLILRFGMGTSLAVRLQAPWQRMLAIVRISLPVCVSIVVYAGVYWALLALILSRLGDEAVAGLGIGFQVFEGVAFPCYLGVSIATASLVGRAIGARDRVEALRMVAAGRQVARWLGLVCAAIFLFGHPFIVPLFTQDPGVLRETSVYVFALAFSQYHVAVETVNEKVLLGAGFTGPILWISPLGNLLRIPLAWGLALGLGWGAAGVWWAINTTTFLKAFLLWARVQQGLWLEHGLAQGASAGIEGS